MAMMRLLAREDVGLAVLPPIVVEEELAAGTLVEIEALTGIVETFHAVVADRALSQSARQGTAAGRVRRRANTAPRRACQPSAPLGRRREPEQLERPPDRRARRRPRRWRARVP